MKLIKMKAKLITKDYNDISVLIWGHCRQLDSNTLGKIKNSKDFAYMILRLKAIETLFIFLAD